MIDVKKAQMLFGCCCVCLTVATASWADFVGVVSEFKIDEDTADLCGAGPYALTVCNVSIQFDDDDDRLLSVAFSDLQVLGAPGALFNHHVFGGDTPYQCIFLRAFPDLICDSFVTIGEKCEGEGSTVTDQYFDSGEFNNNGHIVGGWFNSYPSNGLGDAYNYPDGKVLILNSAVASGLSVEGSATVYWHNIGDPQVFQEAVQIVCGVGCPDDYLCSDGDSCTEDDVCNNQVCQGTPIDCSGLDNDCNEGVCDPSTDPGTCVQAPTNEGGACDDGDPCTASSQCSGGQCTGDPECVVDVDCNDSDGCTDDACLATGCCSNTAIGCDDNDPCTEDSCDFDAGGCVSTPIGCPEGQACDPDTGQCVAVPAGFLDIIPGKCPNRLRRNGSGFLKVSLVSASQEDGGPFNACEVDVSTIQLCRADGSAGCAQPASNPAPRCRDRATPFLGELCGCHGLRKDGLDDLDMRFKVADVVNNLGLVDMPAGVPVGLELTALTNDGQTVIARDCVELGRDLGPNP